MITKLKLKTAGAGWGVEISGYFDVREFDPATNQHTRRKEYVLVHYLTPVEARHVYRGFDVVFYPHIPSAADLLAYDELRSGVMGENRERTRSGRAWKAVKAAKGSFSAVSFWARRAKVAADEIGLVVAALKLKSPIYVEFIDSKKPEPFQSDEVQTVALRSKVAPKLTPEQLIDVLVRGHIAPQSLTKLERAVVDEFRGTRAETKATELAGFGSAAEKKFKTTIGDSLHSGHPNSPANRIRDFEHGIW